MTTDNVTVKFTVNDQLSDGIALCDAALQRFTADQVDWFNRSLVELKTAHDQLVEHIHFASVSWQTWAATWRQGRAIDVAGRVWRAAPWRHRRLFARCVAVYVVAAWDLFKLRLPDNTTEV